MTHLLSRRIGPVRMISSNPRAREGDEACPVRGEVEEGLLRKELPRGHHALAVTPQADEVVGAHETHGGMGPPAAAVLDGAATSAEDGRKGGGVGVEASSARVTQWRRSEKARRKGGLDQGVIGWQSAH